MRSLRSKQRLFFAALVGTLLAAIAIQKAPGAPVVTKSETKAAPTAEQVNAARSARSAAKERRHDAEYLALIATYREPGSLLKNITQSAAAARETHAIAERYVNRSQIMQRDDKNSYFVAPDTSTLLADIKALRLLQRAEIRSTLTRDQRPQFDANVAMVVAKQRGRTN
jgi:hypothetical protein